MIRIGVGITTRNRKEHLVRLIESLRAHTKVPYQLFVAVDGSTDGTVEYLVNNGIEFTYGPIVGSDLNKNRVFRRFLQFNAFFVIEDDMEIKDDRWIEAYGLAAHFTNMPFFAYADTGHPAYKELKVESIGSSTIAWVTQTAGGILYYTRRVMEKVGGIDERFRGYGYGVQEQIQRMQMAGVLPKNSGIPVITCINRYVVRQDGISHTLKETGDSERILKRLVVETRNSENYYRKL